MSQPSPRFGMLGVGGFVAPRHLQAIADNGGTLVAACDPFDSVGILDRHFPEASFFTEFERFDRHLEKLRRSEEGGIDFMSICSPNYLHDAHVRLALRVGAHAICEKPLVINPWNLDQLAHLEEESGMRVYTVLQLRHIESLRKLREQMQARSDKAEVVLTYITRRGRWYHVSWKAHEAKSGGVCLNIGIHFFDLLMWLFGKTERMEVHERADDRASGFIELERARVRWLLSTRGDDLPPSVKDAGGYAFRSLTHDGQEVEFSTGFTDLHTEVYRQTIAGNGCGIADARPSIELAYQVRTSPVTLPSPETAHPRLAR